MVPLGVFSPPEPAAAGQHGALERGAHRVPEEAAAAEGGGGRGARQGRRRAHHKVLRDAKGTDQVFALLMQFRHGGNGKVSRKAKTNSRPPFSKTCLPKRTPTLNDKPTVLRFAVTDHQARSLHRAWIFHSFEKVWNISTSAVNCFGISYIYYIHGFLFFFFNRMPELTRTQQFGPRA